MLEGVPLDDNEDVAEVLLEAYLADVEVRGTEGALRLRRRTCTSPHTGWLVRSHC